MSKLTKLITKPRLFFADMVNKKTPSSKINSPNVASKAAAILAPTLKVDAFNFFIPMKMIICTGEGEKSGSAHLNTWLPYFAAANVNFGILVRNMALYDWVRKTYPLFSVAYAKNTTDVEQIMQRATSLKKVFYPSNTGNNIHLLRFNHIDHVFIGHGDSDKSASAHKFFRVYDEIWVSGQAHIDRFKNAGFELRHLNFVKVGRPSLTRLLTETKKSWGDRFPSARILYLPTWEGHYEEQNYTSIPISGEIIRSIHQKFGIGQVIKYHPSTGSKNKQYENIREELGAALSHQGIKIGIEPKLSPIENLIPNANMFICDISAAISECLAADAPIFVYIPPNKNINILASDMPYNHYCYTFSSTEELMEIMQRVLDGDDYLAPNRDEAIEYIISKKQTIEQAFVTELKRINNN